MRPTFVRLVILCAAFGSAGPAGGIRVAVAQSLPQEPPVLNGGAEVESSAEGYYTLRWDVPEGTDRNVAADGALIFELVEQTGTVETVRYKGPDLATTLSGIPDGAYRYRVRLVETSSGRTGPWSAEYTVIVEHHPLSRAFTFLAVGAIVFLATLIVIVLGHNREHVEAQESA